MTLVTIPIAVMTEAEGSAKPSSIAKATFSLVVRFKDEFVANLFAIL